MLSRTSPPQVPLASDRPTAIARPRPSGFDHLHRHAGYRTLARRREPGRAYTAKRSLLEEIAEALVSRSEARRGG